MLASGGLDGDTAGPAGGTALLCRLPFDWLPHLRAPWPRLARFFFVFWGAAGALAAAAVPETDTEVDADSGL